MNKKLLVISIIVILMAVTIAGCSNSWPECPDCGSTNVRHVETMYRDGRPDRTFYKCQACDSHFIEKRN